MTKQSLVYAMFNSNIFQEVKNNIHLIERFYLTDPNTMTNTLIRKLLDSIKHYDISSIDEPLFRSILANEGKTDTESDLILNEIMKYKLYDENQIKPIRDHVRAIGNQALISLAASMYSSDPEGYIKYLKTNEYKKDTSNIMTTISFDQLDINSIISKSNVGWESHYRFINETYDPLFKYETGQMIMVTGKPGTGKTLFMMSECLHMTINGARSHYIALGDMNPGDFVQRMGAMYSGFSFAEAKLQMVNMFNGLSSLMKDRLGLTIIPSAEITVDDYLDYVMERIDDYDVFFIDYDSNFKPTKEANMYIEGGYLYDKLTTLTNAGKLVFIAAQPKISAWGKEELELPDVGESSRKQHSVDAVIGISAGPGPNHIGKFTIPKNRRGEVGIVQPYVRLNNGRFITIPDSVYNKIKGIHEKRVFSEGDINAMIAEEEALMAKAKEIVNQNVPPIFSMK
jgi:hypothetical protein